MLQKMVINKIVNLLAKQFNLFKVMKYVEEPNDADRKIEKLETKLQMLIEDSHPPAIDLEEWEDMKDVMKKLKNKKAFKSIG